MIHVNAQPYVCPYNGDLQAKNTALLMIDMQTDFCGAGGYIDHLGIDISLTRRPIDGEPIIDKPGKGAFYATDYNNHVATVEMIRLKGGVFCAVTRASVMLEAVA